MREDQQAVTGTGCQKTNMAYTDNFEHIHDELKKLDLLIRQRIIKIRQQHAEIRQITLDPKLYVSHEEVDYLLYEAGDERGNPGNCSDFPGLVHDLTGICSQIKVLQQVIDNRVSASMENHVFLALPRLAQLFNLSPFELQVIIICLAPELRRKYDKIFVYLQDDITRKKPGLDMVLDLLCQAEEEKWKARDYFCENSPLIRPGIIQAIHDPQNPSASSDLARFLKPDPRILNFILGNNTIDSRLIDLVKLCHPSRSMEDLLIDSTVKNRVSNIINNHLALVENGEKRLVLHFHGLRGIGKRDLALGICRQLNCILIHLDMELVLASAPEAPSLLRLVGRECLLVQGILYIDNIDILFSAEPRSSVILKMISLLAAEYGIVTILAGEKPFPLPGCFENLVFKSTALPVPDANMRQKAWERALENEQIVIPPKNTCTAELACQFRLTPGQIRAAVEFARYHFLLGNNSDKKHNDQKNITLEQLYAACRSQSNQKLVELAAKIKPTYRWTDLILVEEKIMQLKEICSQVKYRHRVFDQWGFQEKLSHGRGLSVLFSGSPGTGKTMAAGVIAHELQLDLYKIDLSGVVSKYIGETEKNLARIFYEAETSNAILFFDEADALFGKRTEVSDAHDRYANIETSFLLQKMEEYEGMVILATNLRKNMDDAFTRRIRFIVEFPFPDENSRLRIWKTHFPGKAPLDEKIDYESLARQFPVSGGSIRNIVLNAAFYAARNGGIIGMEHILRSARREYEKVGKLWPRDAELS